MSTSSLLTAARNRFDRLISRAEPFDDMVDRWFDPLRGNPLADEVFYRASEWADYSKLWHVINIAMAATRPDRRRDAVRLAVALGIESALVNGGIKRALPRERPPMLDREREVRRPKTTSFPSGHASSAVMAAVLLGDSAPRLRPLWWGMAAVVASSRIHNRMHHASDVVAGGLIGLVLGRIMLRLWPLDRP